MLMSIDVYGSCNFLPDDIGNLKAAALYYAVGDHCHAKAYGSLLWHRAGLDVSVSAPLNICRFLFVQSTVVHCIKCENCSKVDIGVGMLSFLSLRYTMYVVHLPVHHD